MAVAPAASDVPCEFFAWGKVTSALAGAEEGEVGAGPRRLSGEESQGASPDALQAIRNRLWHSVSEPVRIA
jgi:hypothetical protein